MLYYYTSRRAVTLATVVPTFEFFQYRFHLEAVDTVCFPPGRSANIIRGACGVFLRKTAPTDVYTRLFAPGRSLGAAPSGLSDWPRPFVLRTASLDGLNAAPGQEFCFDLHLFDTRFASLPYFEKAFSEWACSGMGTARGRARLVRTEPLGGLCSIPLHPEEAPVDRVVVRFITPTELKTHGGLATSPEFAVLFARLRDRICTLRALYGPGPLELDFRGMGARATTVRLVRDDLHWENATRTSSRTGQTHPLGGFTGEAEYAGALQEFLPWLQAARWVGVGRHTVWGKGELHVIESSSNRPPTSAFHTGI